MRDDHKNGDNALKAACSSFARTDPASSLPTGLAVRAAAKGKKKSKKDKRNDIDPREKIKEHIRISVGERFRQVAITRHTRHTRHNSAPSLFFVVWHCTNPRICRGRTCVVCTRCLPTA